MTRRPPARALATALAAALLLAAAARTARAADPDLPFERYTLPNGLEVILHPDRTVPLVVVDVWYHVGSGDETPGKSGFAHLFEHMMFQGSVHVGEDRHFDILKQVGASTVNGSTNTDRTNYFEVVPANQIETALWLESDRMGYLLPLLNDRSFANQRSVVRNERRQNYDSRPYGKERFAVNEALYPEGHPYRHLTIGLHEDLERASVEDVRGFFRRWYVPANATLVLAGDFDPAEAKRLVEKWFGSFPASQRPAHRAAAPAPITRTRKVTITDELARLRRVHWAWHTPAFFAPGDAELDALADVLGRTGTGRLYRILVHEQQLAQAVMVYQSSAGFSSSFHVVVDLRPEADQAQVERILEEEIDRVRREPVGARELARAVTSFETTTIWGLESLIARAERLQRYNHYVGRPDYVTADLDRYRTATPAGVREVAARHLAREARVEVITLPAEGK